MLQSVFVAAVVAAASVADASSAVKAETTSKNGRHCYSRIMLAVDRRAAAKAADGRKTTEFMLQGSQGDHYVGLPQHGEFLLQSAKSGPHDVDQFKDYPGAPQL